MSGPSRIILCPVCAKPVVVCNGKLSFHSYKRAARVMVGTRYAESMATLEVKCSMSGADVVEVIPYGQTA